MAGISSKALNGIAENKYNYSGKEEQRKEFLDGSGLETYDFNFRIHDPQICRFWQIDPLSSEMPASTHYSFAANNPIKYVDLMGLSPNEPNEPCYITTTYVDKNSRVLNVVNDGKTEIIQFDDIDFDTWNPNNNSQLPTRAGGRLIGHTIYWYDFMSLNEGNGELGKPLFGSYIRNPLTFYWASLFKVFQNDGLVNSNSFKNGGDLLSLLNQDWQGVLENYFFYLLALKRLAGLSGNDAPYDIKSTLLDMKQGYLYSSGIGKLVLPTFTTGRALGNILFGMNMNSVSNMSWSKKRDVWNIAMSAVGAYNEKDGSKMKDRTFQGEHPYSGSYIWLGYWGSNKSSY